LILTIQAVRGLPRLRAPGIGPCIIYLFIFIYFYLLRPKAAQHYHYKDRRITQETKN